MHMHWNVSLTPRTLNKYFIKLSILIFMWYKSFLNAIRRRKCVLKLLIYVFLYLTLFFINMCRKAVSDDPFVLKYCINRYETQEMCDKAVDGFLLALKFVIDWFVINKMIKKLHNALFADDDIIFLMKILVMSHFLGMKWVFLV